MINTTSVSIEAGCFQVIGTNTWWYVWTDNDGDHQEAFTAYQTPKIGDTIDLVNNILVPLVGYKINNDPGKAQGRVFEDSEWPSRIRAQ